MSLTRAQFATHAARITNTAARWNLIAHIPFTVELIESEWERSVAQFIEEVREQIVELEMDLNS